MDFIKIKIFCAWKDVTFLNIKTTNSLGEKKHLHLCFKSLGSKIYLIFCNSKTTEKDSPL